MRNRSPRGSSTPTSRLTSRLHGPLLLAVAVVLIPLAGFYVIEAFIAPNPLVRIGLRTLPALPVAIWTLWFETSRPLERQRPLIRVAGRIALLVLVMAFAAMLHAGLSGIRQKLPLPPPVEENLYAFDPERLARHQLGHLPASLAEALRDLRQDEVMRDALGVHLLERFIEAKEMEWQSYEKQVTPWELDAYLEAY